MASTGRFVRGSVWIRGEIRRCAGSSGGATGVARAGIAEELFRHVVEARDLVSSAPEGRWGIDGPRVLANMALDRWFPSRFATLSDRFVTQNGILLMGGAALLVMLLTRGAVGLLVVLYSINVFITFVLSQTGMVRHWFSLREGGWRTSACG